MSYDFVKWMGTTWAIYNRYQLAYYMEYSVVESSHKLQNFKQWLLKSIITDSFEPEYLNS